MRRLLFVPKSLNTKDLILLVLIALGSSILSAVVNIDSADTAWWSGWLQNFSTEMFGAIATFGLFELLIGGRNRAEAKAQERKIEQARFLAQLRHTKTRAQAVAIVEQMNALDLLQGAHLKGVNLQGAHLSMANLNGA